MAVAATAVIAGTYYKSWTLTALDADTATSVVHGFGFTPDFVEYQPGITYASTATPSFGATTDATNIYFVKSNTTGSGGASPGTTVIGKLYGWKPHSIII